MNADVGATFSPAYFVFTALAVLVALLTAARALNRRGSRWRLVHVFRLVMIGAFSVGTCTHLENAWRAGLVPLPQEPLAFNLYWTALTALDPLAALLLVVRPRVGLVLSVGIMVSDVSINAYAFPPMAAFRFEWPFWLQFTFATFVLAVSPYCWSRLGRRSGGSSDGAPA